MTRDDTLIYRAHQVLGFRFALLPTPRILRQPPHLARVDAFQHL